MSDNTDYDAVATEAEMANAGLPAVREPQPVAPAEAKPPITAAQAKVEAVANLTFKAYERASMLELTKDISDALQAPFPDEAFRPGAAGKESLIYIEHSALRERLNTVLGLGQWAIIPRNRWGEDFQYFDKETRQYKEATRIYVEAMLVVRGCFVAEAVGDMVYYKSSASTNYGDAVEGAKTAAFRRCAKELGVGLQAWSKEWCEGWWQRKRGRHQRPAETQPPIEPASGTGNSRTGPITPPPPPSSQPPPPKVAPAAKGDVKAPAPPAETPEHRKTRWLEECIKAGGGRGDYAEELFKELGVLLPNEHLVDLPVEKVPTSRKTADQLLEQIRQKAGVGEPPEQFEETSDQEPPEADEPWRVYPMPWGKQAGVALGKLDKKYLFGLWANYTVESHFNGKPKKPETIQKDREFRAMLDAAGVHYEFTKKD